jgi:ubiquinone/menaquinone biosynthesis C-methylase UbiE
VTINSDLERVVELWDKTVRERAVNPIQGWLDSPIVLENYVQPTVSDAPQVNWLVGLMERVGIARGGRWLSLGCGAAALEIFASKRKLFDKLFAVDVSPASVEEARRAAAAEEVSNIEFLVSDLSRLELPRSAYDVVLMNMSLHHVKELRSVLSNVRRTLVPDGFFLVNEFIGPRQFQFPDLQLSLVGELLAALPLRWRQDSATGEIKTQYVKQPVEHWNVADPSEAIRSDLIVSEVERQFRVLERRDYGGTILNLLLEHIVHNFDPADEKDVAAIRLLGAIESILIRHGVIPSDFTVMAMKKRSFSVSRLFSALSSREKRAART